MSILKDCKTEDSVERVGGMAAKEQTMEWTWWRQLALIATLQEHGKWWRSGGSEGRRANLGGADLGGAYLGGANLGGADLGGAYLGGANLGGAYLRGADLGSADLGGAYLRGADLGGAYLGGANLGGAADPELYKKLAPLLEGVPVVPQLHTKMLAAIEAGGTLDMQSWHGDEHSDGDGDEQPLCGTTHCRAGWAIHLAGDAGYALEKRTSPDMAGFLITLASCPWLDRRPDFYCRNDAALKDIKACAAREQETAKT